MIHQDHQSKLNQKDYKDGGLREKDVISRMTPRLTQELNDKNLRLGSPVFIRIFKESKELELWVQHASLESFHLYKTYPIAAMSGKLGPKRAEGDRQAPEGFYYVTQSQMKPDSSYHLAFNIGYPNTYDLAHQRTGSFIMVHGDKRSIGCFAMTDPYIEEIYTLCSKALHQGQPYFRVHSFPFRMTEERLTQEKNHRWYDFWKNLQEGYDAFEKSKKPPNVKVAGKRYSFRL
ncbi:MAG: L,D-transpeptidase family protein [Akkermansiaceae bacterium]